MILKATQWRNFGLKMGDQARGVIIKWGSVPHSKMWGPDTTSSEIRPMGIGSAAFVVLTLYLLLPTLPDIECIKW